MLQEGLKGNRVIEPSLWAVVTALERAFPLLLGPTMQAATAALPVSAEQPQHALQLWLLQVRMRCFRPTSAPSSRAQPTSLPLTGSIRRYPGHSRRQVAGPAAAAQRLRTAGARARQSDRSPVPGVRSAAAGGVLCRCAEHCSGGNAADYRIQRSRG